MTRALTAALLAVIAASVLVIAPPTASAAGPEWWSGDYSRRIRVEVATVDALPASYQVMVTLDHAALVAAGQSLANGDDVRFVRWDGSGWEPEQDRVVAVGSAWNQSDTKLYFKTTTGIAAASTDASYFLYFGSNAPPPALADPENVYDLFEDFASGTIDPVKWGTTLNGAGSVSAASGAFVSDGQGSVGSEGHWLNTQATFASATDGLMVESTFRLDAFSDDSWGASFGLAGSATAMYLDKFWQPGTTVAYWMPGDGYSVMTLTGAPSALTAVPTGSHRMGQAITAGGVVRHFEDGVLLASGAGAFPYADQIWFGFDPYTAGQTYNASYDDIVVRKYINTEPVVSLEAVETVTASESTALAVAVDPFFTFAVGGRSGTCNGVNLTGTSDATRVALGRATVGIPVAAGQDLNVTSNAANGFVVLHRGQWSNGPRAITDVPAAAGSTGTFGSGERFGYTTDDTDVPGFTGPRWARLSSVGAVVAAGDTLGFSAPTCVAYQLTVDGSTPAGTYAAVVHYTAIPTF